ncbi:MAG: alpha/beta hydrolase [Actinomycetota bacterium]|nr:alpha/beta hydrolase [Actinomycetota bacterium]
MRRGFATVTSHDGLTIATETTRWGTQPAPAALAVHATGFCKEVFRPVVGMLATLIDAGAVTALDHRGHGSSDRPPVPVDWWDLGRDSLAVIAQIGDLQPGAVVGVGHSAGGAAVVMAELLAPGTFSSLVLIEPIVFPPPHRRMEDHAMIDAALRRKRLFDSPAVAGENFAAKPTFAGWHPAALADYVEHGMRPTAAGWALACDPEVEAEFYRTGPAHDAWERLGELALPITLIVGERSDTHHGGYLETLAGRFGGEPLLDVVPAASHLVPMERPEVVAGHVARCLGNCASGHR